MTSSAVSLEVGEIVVYGPEGFARVDGCEEREILGKTVTVVDLFVMDSSMRVSVPLDRALERGLRPVASVDDAEGALEALASRFDAPIPWNRDGRLVKDRYAEGDLEAMVEVISTLVDVECDPPAQRRPAQPAGQGPQGVLARDRRRPERRRARDRRAAHRRRRGRAPRGDAASGRVLAADGPSPRAPASRRPARQAGPLQPHQRDLDHGADPEREHDRAQAGRAAERSGRSPRTVSSSAVRATADAGAARAAR